MDDDLLPRSERPRHPSSSPFHVAGGRPKERPPARRPYAALAVLAAVLLVLVGRGVTAGHVPTPGKTHYADLAVDSYSFESPVPSWLRVGFNAASLTDWLTDHYNVAPKWTYSASSVNLVSYIFRVDTGDENECDPSVKWIACAWYDANHKWGAIEYVKEEKLDVGWCENTPGDGCNEVERVALHELGHVAGFARSSDGFTHPAVKESFTIMRKVTPPKPNFGWSSSQVKVCDQIAFQLLYGIDSFSSDYADCVDHLGAGTSNGKITTVVSQTGGTLLVCTGVPVAFSGTAKLSADSNLQQIADNPLEDRSVSLRRGGSTVASDSVSSSGAWSLSYTAPNGTYVFTGYFAGELALDADTSSGRTITWSSAC